MHPCFQKLSALCQLLHAGSHLKCQALQDEIRAQCYSVILFSTHVLSGFTEQTVVEKEKAEIIPDLQELFLIRCIESHGNTMCLFPLVNNI